VDTSAERDLMRTILLVILILLLLGALPLWPYSTGWGYFPGGAIGLILIEAVDVSTLFRTQSPIGF
jgi:hypothetical protein